MGETSVTGHAIVRDERGKFAQGTEPPNKITSSTQAHALARARWDKAKEAARQGLLDGVNRSGVVPSIKEHPVEAWGEIVAHGAELACVSDSTRGFAEIARFVGQASDMLPSRDAVGDTAGDVARSVAAGMVDSLLDRLERLVNDANGTDE